MDRGLRLDVGEKIQNRLVHDVGVGHVRGVRRAGHDAHRHFPAEPLTAVPCAISSVVHSVIGSLLAGWWRLRP